MKTKTLRNVDEETWRSLKILSAKAGINMAILLKLMIIDFEKNNRKFWASFFNKESLLNDEEAKDMEKIVKSLRKEGGFRE